MDKFQTGDMFQLSTEHELGVYSGARGIVLRRLPQDQMEHCLPNLDVGYEVTLTSYNGAFVILDPEKTTYTAETVMNPITRWWAA